VEELREVLNWIIQNWHFLGAVVVAIFSWIFGKAKIQALIKEIADIFQSLIQLTTTIKIALEDKDLTEEETKKIKQDIDKLITDFKDLILLFKK